MTTIQIILLGMAGGALTLIIFLSASILIIGWLLHRAPYAPDNHQTATRQRGSKS